MEAAGNPVLQDIVNQVERATELGALRALHDRMPDMARDWQAAGQDACTILSWLNDVHDQLIRRTIEWTLADLESSGRGSPPSPFCWFLLGSGGRREQTLAPDQDHALLYLEEADTRGGAQAFFAAAAERVVERLAAIGYAYCPGFVMPTNQRWNRSLSDWQRAVETYASYPDVDNARFLTMTADLRLVYGDVRLADRFRAWFFEQARKLSFIHWQEAQHELQQPVALDWRGRFRIETWGDHAGAFNLKEGGYLQIVSATRLWALAHGIDAVSTADRIAMLRERNVWDKERADQVLQAWRDFVRYRIWGNHVDPGRLSQAEAFALKEAMTIARQLQKQTARRFRKPK